jgi:Peptidase family M28
MLLDDEIQNFPFVMFTLFFCIILLSGDEKIPGKKAMISIKNLKGHVQSIHFDRNPYDHYSALEQAAKYIEREFLRVGMEVKEDSFQWEGRTYKNIVAEKKGAVFPHKVFIVGAHYDTVPGSPGADDNASAIAVLLEVARNIHATQVDVSIRFIAFSLEEYNFVGSTRYVERVKKGEEEILGMISLEMVGFTGPKQNYPPPLNPKYYPNVGDFIAVIGNERSKGLLENVCRSFKTHIPQLPLEFLIVPGKGEGMEAVRLSDHCPFWDQGYPALMVTDTSFLRNPNYHLPSDTLETLDFEFMNKVAVGIYYSVAERVK